MIDLLTLRTKLELSQLELGKILKVKQSAISHYESGKRDLTLKKIAKYKQKLIEHFGAEKIETLFNGVSNQSIVDNNSSYTNKNMEIIMQYFNFSSEEQKSLVAMVINEVTNISGIDKGDIILALKNPSLFMSGIFVIEVNNKQYISRLYLSSDGTKIILQDDNTEKELLREEVKLLYEIKGILKKV